MDIGDILRIFGVEDCADISELKSGHINRTFLAETSKGKYIVQSLNRDVFKAPEAVMDNIDLVCRAFGDYTEESVSVPKFLYQDERNYILYDGELWRAYGFTAEEASFTGAERAFSAGQAYGSFIRIMSAEKPKLKKTAEGFHDLRMYFSKLQSAMAASPMKKIDSTVLSRIGNICDTLDHVFPVSFQKRIIHGDAKTDNVILGSRAAVIDLDTVMYGYAAIDFGDIVRSVCGSADHGYSLTRSAVNGFARGLKGILSADETDSLYYGVLWVTAELAVRYLTDYVSEEHYFRSKTPSECLLRANELIVQLNRFINDGDVITDMIYSAFGKVKN